MIKGQQDISKLRNEMATINKAGAGRKFLVAMSRMFNRSRKAKLPTGKSARKDMGIGSSVQNFKIKKPERGSLKIMGNKRVKSAGVDNDLEKATKEHIRHPQMTRALATVGGALLGGAIGHGVGGGVARGIRERLGRPLSRKAYRNLSNLAHISESHGHLAGTAGGGILGYRASGEKTRKLDDINNMTKGLAERLARIGRARKAVQVGSKPMRHLTRRLTHTTVNRGYYSKSLDTQINDLRKAYPNIGGLKAGGVKGRTTMPPRTSTEISESMGRARAGTTVGHGPAARPMAERLRTAPQYRPNLPGVQTTRKPGVGVSGAAGSLKAHRIGQLPGVKTSTGPAGGLARSSLHVGRTRAATKTAATSARGLRTAGKIGAGAAAVGGGALLAGHLLRRHQAKKAARQAATNPAAGSIAQGMMGCLANMQKRMDRMKK